MDPDVLVHEATNENAHKDKCIDNGHSTPGRRCLSISLVFSINCIC